MKYYWKSNEGVIRELAQEDFYHGITNFLGEGSDIEGLLRIGPIIHPKGKWYVEES